MKAIIPAAGYAKRMWPLTSDKPKHFLDINGKPVLDYVVEKVNALDVIDQIFVVTNDLFFPIFEEWAKKYDGRCGLKILNDGTSSDEDRLGAIGDLNFVLEKEEISDDFIFILGDNLFNFDLKSAHEEFVRKGKPVIALYDVKDLEIAKRMNSIKMDEENKVVYFKEKDPDVVDTKISIGVYFYSKKCISMIGEYLSMGLPSDKPGDFVGWLHKQEDVYGYVYGDEGDKWFDVGDMGIYEEVKRIWK